MITVAGTTLRSAGQQLFTGGPAADFRTVGVSMALGAAALSGTPDLGIPLCPLRALTGVPCPFCGMTTASLAAAHGHIGSSVAANPAAIVLLIAIAIAFVPAIYRSRTLRRVSQRWQSEIRWLPWIALPLLWIWQLDRFGFL